VGDMTQQEACLDEHVLERVRPEEVHSDCQPNDIRGDCQPFDEANPSYWYLPPAAGMSADYKFTYKLPDGVTCEKCTLQWWWSSANSCTPHPDAYRCYFQRMEALKWTASDWCSGACVYNDRPCPASQGANVLCGEQFKNCADVQRERARGRSPNGGSDTCTIDCSDTGTDVCSDAGTVCPDKCTYKPFTSGMHCEHSTGQRCDAGRLRQVPDWI